MKVFVEEKPFVYGAGFYTYVSHMSPADRNVEIVQTPEDNKGKYEQDSMLDFIKRVSQSENFDETSSFTFFRYPAEINEEDAYNITYTLLKKIFYSGTPAEQVSLTVCCDDNGWKHILLYNSCIAVINLEKNNNGWNMFAALPAKIEDTEENAVWNKYAENKKLIALTKSRIIEGLMDAEIYG